MMREFPTWNVNRARYAASAGTDGAAGATGANSAGAGAANGERSRGEWGRVVSRSSSGARTSEARGPFSCTTGPRREMRLPSRSARRGRALPSFSPRAVSSSCWSRACQSSRPGAAPATVPAAATPARCPPDHGQLGEPTHTPVRAPWSPWKRRGDHGATRCPNDWLDICCDGGATSSVLVEGGHAHAGGVGRPPPARGAGHARPRCT